MSLYFTSQILVLALLVPVVIRFLFTRSARIDTAVILSPFACGVSVLNLFVYGTSVMNILLIIVTVFVALINFRALLRLVGGLVVDFYRGPFILGCVISWLLIGAVGTLLVWFCPIADRSLSLKGAAADPVSVEKQVYTGTAFGGMQEKNGYFGSPAAVLYTVSPKTDAKNTVVLYLPGVCTRTADFMPALKQLAQKGYPVIGADFSVKDIPYTGTWRDGFWYRDFYMRSQRLNDPESFAASAVAWNEKKAQEAQLLLELARKQFPDATFVLVYDRESKDAIENALPEIQHIQIDFGGAALLALTNPLDALMLDVERWDRRNRQQFKELPDQIAWYIINCLG